MFLIKGRKDMFLRTIFPRTQTSLSTTATTKDEVNEDEAMDDLRMFLTDFADSVLGVSGKRRLNGISTGNSLGFFTGNKRYIPN